jgi:hypothetical protein
MNMKYAAVYPKNGRVFGVFDTPTPPFSMPTVPVSDEVAAQLVGTPKVVKFLIDGEVSDAPVRRAPSIETAMRRVDSHLTASGFPDVARSDCLLEFVKAVAQNQVASRPKLAAVVSWVSLVKDSALSGAPLPAAPHTYADVLAE